jgi:cyclophilin family peptidyl-prolyl cis-trans isomerase
MQPLQLASLLSTLFSVLVPARMWVPNTQPIQITLKSSGPVALVLTDFTGRNQIPTSQPTTSLKSSASVNAGDTVDLRAFFPTLKIPGAYVLWAIPEGKKPNEFVGTPLVLTVRSDNRPGAANPTEVWVTRVEPLRYGVISTDLGTMTCAFFYDVAPDTTSVIQELAEQGFYDGLVFHRIVPGFVAQGGDPLGEGRGGPGFNIDAEFSTRKHERGVLSMARSSDPLEPQGFKPRCEFANSAGSQFFICLKDCPSLDGKYTVFGTVTDGLDVVDRLGATPVDGEKPKTPPVIRKFEIKPVTAAENPYAGIIVVVP